MSRHATPGRLVRVFAVLLLSSFSIGLKLAAAGAPAAAGSPASAPPGTVLGKGVSDAKLVPIADLVKDPAAYVGKTIRVEGLVTDVCPMRGCWMNLASDTGGATVKIKVDDGVIVFPKAAKGKHAVAEGVFTKIEQTHEEALAYAKHLAEEKGEKFDPAKAGDVASAIYQIQGTGAVIR